MKLLLAWLATNWLGVLAIIIAAIAAYFSYEQNKITKKLSHLHISPVVKCVFDFPPKENPIFSVSNEGDIPAIALSISHNMYVFDKNTKSITSAMKMGYLFGDRVIFRKELEPAEHAEQELARVDPVDNKVTIYQFYLKYFREIDMQEYTSTELFFVDDGKTFPHKEFRKNEFYQKIIMDIESVKFPKTKIPPGKLKKVLKGISDNKDNQNE